MEQRQIVFPPFQLDCVNEQVWRSTADGTSALRLRPKTFAVLCYLVERAQQLVTKGQLLDAIWSETYVTDSALKTCIRELREALDDDPKAPQFIETVHRRGYRFVAAITAAPVPSSKFKVQSSPSPLAPNTQPLAPILVGREAELTQLHQALNKALNGERQIVFVTGEAGVGKTTIVDAFLHSLESRVQSLESEDQKPPLPLGPTLDPRHQTLDLSPWIARGQCVDHYGAGEPYMPMLEALGRLCRGPDGKRLIALLNQYAPTWLVQMPALLNTAELGALHAKVRGATQTRMLREMAEAIEVLTNERPLLLILEDLHWSDYSTVALLSLLARRREPVRLLILGTYRPAEVLDNGHPLRGLPQELQLRGYSHELRLEGISRSAVTEYLFQRFPHHRFPPQVARFVYERTEGNPLFVVHVVDELERQAFLTRVNDQWILQRAVEKDTVGIPGTLKQVIEQQIDDYADTTRQILETASLVGIEFSSAAVAVGLTQNVEVIEACCDQLVRRQRFLRSGEIVAYPDGTKAARYGFVHTLYQEVLYHRLAGQRRERLHRQIGEWEEARWEERGKEIAAELAMHFERGQDAQRAVRYHKQAADNALQRSAHHEALRHLDTGLELLKKLPDSTERVEQELVLQLARAVPLGTLRGYSTSEVKEAYQRAQALCQVLGGTLRRFSILAGLAVVHHMQGNLRQARELQEQILHLAREAGKPILLLWAHILHGVTSYNCGHLITAQAQLMAGLEFYDPHRHNPQVSGGTEDPGVLCLTTLASTLWLLGYPDHALRRIHEALTLAEQLGDPPSQAIALGQAAVLHQRCRDKQAALECADRLIALVEQHGLPSRLAMGMIYRGWAVAECGQVQEGLAQLCSGLHALEATGTVLARPYYLALLSEVYGKVGQFEKSLSVLQEALITAHTNDDRFYEAEVWRLQGELTLQKLQVSSSEFRVLESQKSKGKSQKSKIPSTQPLAPNTQEAEACFHRAIEIARQQQAKSLELRATMSLSRRWQEQGKKKQAYKLLSKIYRWFTEGFQTMDLREAKALLETLR